jgi:methanogenic corrinoid protein MtbC1
LTSIELDTLRMWERRYGFPKPERSEGGSRRYSDEDVECLKLIRRALDLGYRPGEVVGKPRADLVRLVAPTGSGTAGMPRAAPTLETLLGALERDDVAALRRGLRQVGILLGPKAFVTDVAHPLAVRVGELWAEGKLEVRHEHVMSECLSAQLRVLAAAYEDGQAAPRVLLTSLPDERHGLGLEMVALYLAVCQVTPRTIGPDTPPEQIVKSARAHSADAVGILVTEASDPKRTAQHVRWMLGELPRRVPIWLGGRGAGRVGLREEAVRVVATWDDLERAIEALRAPGGAAPRLQAGER